MAPRTCFNPEFSYERCCRKGEPQQLLRFPMDVNKELLRAKSSSKSPEESSWDALLQHVKVAGKFQYAVASHILEAACLKSMKT